MAMYEIQEIIYPKLKLFQLLVMMGISIQAV